MADVTRGSIPVAARTNQETRVERDAKLDALHERLTTAVGGLVSGEVSHLTGYQTYRHGTTSCLAIADASSIDSRGGHRELQLDGGIVQR
jgi:hypothetical protein